MLEADRYQYTDVQLTKGWILHGSLKIHEKLTDLIAQDNKNVGTRLFRRLAKLTIEGLSVIIDHTTRSLSHDERGQKLANFIWRKNVLKQ